VPNADAQAFNAVSSVVIGSKVKGQVSHSTHEPPALYFTSMHLRTSSEHVQAAGPARPECSAAQHEGGVYTCADNSQEHELQGLKRAAESLTEGARRFRKEHGRPFVLVIDNSDRLAAQQPRVSAIHCMAL